MINILILSVGTRNKIVQYFKQTLKDNGQVIACDCSELAPALYAADKHYIVPSICESNYLDVVLDICKKEKISGVLSLIDPELELLSRNKDLFMEIGVTPLVSDVEAVEVSFNKGKMYQFCKEHQINTVKTCFSLDEFKVEYKKGAIAFPVFVKPICGSCSINIQKVQDMKTLEFLIQRDSNLIIQEFMDGSEIGADVYIDAISKNAVSIFTKRKLLMRAGETDKAVSFKDEKLFDFIKNFVQEAKFLYHIDIDIFEAEGKYYISEVNPRFGGGYPHAYECGCNFVSMIINNLQGKSNESAIGNYLSDKLMLKYLDVVIR